MCQPESEFEKVGAPSRTRTLSISLEGFCSILLSQGDNKTPYDLKSYGPLQGKLVVPPGLEPGSNLYERSALTFVLQD
jgi:hypothetical protein